MAVIARAGSDGNQDLETSLWVTELQVLWAVIHCLPRDNRKLDYKQSRWDLNWHCDMGCWHHRKCFNPACHNYVFGFMLGSRWGEKSRRFQWMQEIIQMDLYHLHHCAVLCSKEEQENLYQRSLLWLLGFTYCLWYITGVPCSSASLSPGLLHSQSDHPLMYLGRQWMIV